MQNHNATWVVVANSTLARLFRLVQFPKIEEFETFVHPESRLHNKDVLSSKPGRAFDRNGVQRHAYNEADPKELEMEKFAKHLGKYLCSAYQKGEFFRLYAFASPTFLGHLRRHLDKDIQNALIVEVAKDMTEKDKTEIEQHLTEI